jgi:hypothetical protein
MVWLLLAGLIPRGDRHVPEQGEQTEQEAVGGQDRGVPPDHVAIARRQHGRDRVRVQEQRQGRAERQGRVGNELLVLEDQRARHLLLG